MKFIVSQLTYLLAERQLRQSLRALVKYLFFVAGVITVFSVLFHVIMLRVEGQEHSWLTGFYWTLTVMSTLGFGDITFHSDIGRVFSIVVLLSGIVLLLIVLPFTFIQYFYAPWLEARIRTQAPREAASDLRGHVVICRHDFIAPGLIEKLNFDAIPYVVMEPDPVVAARMMGDGLSVVTGEIDSRATYESVRAGSARLIFANAEDTTNTNITLTVREANRDVPIVALAEDEDSIDILELSGASQVLALKHRLGEHLAARISSGAGSVHVVGRFRDLLVVEFAVRDTPLAGSTLRQTRLRQRTGLTVVAVRERARVRPVSPDLTLSDASVPVALGSPEQVDALKALLGGSGDEAVHPALVIGAGKVGRAAVAALRKRGFPVSVVEKGPGSRPPPGLETGQFVTGDAADREVLHEAKLEKAAAVLLTTNDDAVNVYLAVYCRRLKPELSIVSRITHERNVEAIYRAGADFVLSYASLGREHLISYLAGREPVMIGEGADFFVTQVPDSLVGRPLRESGVGKRTGLVIIGLEHDARTAANLSPDTVLQQGGRLLMLGTAAQRKAFSREFA